MLRFPEFWRFALGLAIVALVLAFPQGLVGGFLRWRERGTENDPLAEAAR